jgi:hypothetical protein
MDKRLLVIENAFHLRGRGVVLWPLVPFDALPHPPQIPFRRTVTLRQPGGTSVSVEAIFTIGTSMPLDHPGYDCLLLGSEKANVPVGTEVWVSEQSSTEPSGR